MPTPELPSALDALRRALASHVARIAPGGDARAAVALVVRPAPAGPEVLLIKRATVAGDPWSGHIALPGGRRAPGDADDRATALRETWEEVGIDLRAVGHELCRLDDVQPRRGAPTIVVSAFVFAVPAGTRASPNHEVEMAFWVPVRHLDDPAHATEYSHAAVDGASLRFPAIGYEGHVIWGLTHRILEQFLQLIAGGAGGGGG